LLRLGRVALEYFSHNRPLFLHGRDVLQVRVHRLHVEIRAPDFPVNFSWCGIHPRSR
jgi:hypothetical protein